MSTTIGKKLLQAREELSLTIEQVAQSTHIRAHYLKSMEAGEFNALPSLTQARGFLRAYANYLNIDPEPLLADLQGIETKPKTPLPPISEKGSSKAKKEESKEANDIFIEIGQMLQNQRGLLGLSIDDVEHQTHLREHYLQMLEAGDIENLPSPVQGRGMLQNYATFLGMDPEPLLLRFADGLLARLAAKQPAVTDKAIPTVQRKPTLPHRLQHILSADLLVGGALLLCLVIFVIWMSIRIFAISSEPESTSTAPSIVDVLLASSTPSDTPTLLPSTPTFPEARQNIPTQLFATFVLTGTLIPNSQTGVQVYIAVSQRAWMRVTVDGKIEYEGRVLPGSAYPFMGETQVEVLTGNGAALQIFFGGTDLGQLGEFGQVVNRIYTRQGILNPTPTVTPTNTETQPVTPTPLITMNLESGEATAPPLP